MIFPEDLDETMTEEAEQELPVPMDWAIDFETGELDLKNGRPYQAEGMEALKVWVWKMLKTPRNVYEYSADLGQEFDQLIGTTDYDLAEDNLQFLIKDALEMSPYIVEVNGFQFARMGSEFQVSFTVNTVYGDFEEETEIEL